MSYQDPIASALTHIRNAQMRRLNQTHVPYSKLIEGMMHVLKREGFIKDFQTNEADRQISVDLRYLETSAHQRSPVIDHIQRVSKPSRRHYVGFKDLHRMTVEGFGVYIMTTPKGVMTHHEARAHRVGGEILCVVA